MKILKEAKGLRTWVEIDTRTLQKNVCAIKRFLSKQTLLMGIVKSNAYGHGLVPAANAIENAGADWLGVDSIIEALHLRKEGLRVPVLVLGSTLPELLTYASQKNISLTISNFEALKNAVLWTEKNKKYLKIHIKIDSGMHRQGFLREDITVLKEELIKKPHFLKIEGIYSHLSAANPKSLSVARAQIKKFNSCVASLRGVLVKPLVHITASGATLSFSDSFDIARIGIALYGLWPSEEVREFAESKIKLTPVLSWRTVIGEVKKIAKGERVGYNSTEAVLRESAIAVCPVGYWQGYPRSLSGKGEVLINGKRAKVLGRVSMDMIVIDVTDIPNVKAGEIVTLIGKDGKEEVSVEEFAERAGTINYEVITCINPLIKRIYYG